MAVNGPVANPRAPPCSGRARRAWARYLPGKPVPLIEQVNADRTPVEITSRRGDAVLMSRADYALEETAHCASRRTPVTFWRAFDRPRRVSGTSTTSSAKVGTTDVTSQAAVGLTRL